MEDHGDLVRIIINKFGKEGANAHAVLQYMAEENDNGTNRGMQTLQLNTESLGTELKNKFPILMMVN